MYNIIVDGHCDTLQRAFDENLSIFNTKFDFNMTNAEFVKPYIQFLASFVNTKYDIGNTAYVRVNEMLDKFYKEYNENKNADIVLIDTKSDLQKIINEGKIGILLTIENGAALSGNLLNLEKLYNRKIKVMSLTWNDDNFLACGAFTKNDTGLTTKGRECIKLMNNLGIIVDVSHIFRRSFFDIINITDKSVIATHSCVNSLCENKRNLTDEQIKLIAKCKGMIGVCFYKGFLSNNKYVTIDNVVEHIEYISNLVGSEFVGIGSDFDGMEIEDKPCGLESILCVSKIKEKLEQRGFKKQEVYNIMGGNYIRILNENLK